MSASQHQVMATDSRRQPSLALSRTYLAVVVISCRKVLLSHNYSNLYKIAKHHVTNVEFSMYKILIILSFSLLASCSDKDIPSSDLVERQGLIYEINSTIPFTGSSVSFHKNALLKQKGKFKDGQVDAQGIKPNKTSGRKKYQSVGLARFIPQIVLSGLDIKLPKIRNYYDRVGIGQDRLGHLVETDKLGSIKKAYYKENFFWRPVRNGYCEQYISADYKWTEADSNTGKEFDTFIGIYWDGERNGYGIKYLKGKVIEKGIYQDGQFVKYYDFDLELMQKTYKKWY